MSHSRGSNLCPTFSPDGRKIAFTSNREGNIEPYNESDSQIYVMNVDGSSVTRLTNPPAEHGCASFSPDGPRIVFMAGSILTGFAIYAMNSDGSGITQVTRPSASLGLRPRFSPDGRKILFDAPFLSTMNPDGSDVVRLKVPDSISCTEAAFSPDSRKIVAACESFQPPLYKVHIHLMNSDGSNMVRLSDPAQFPFGASFPVFSPDGRKIAFEAQVDSQKGEQIFIMNVDGSGVASLTSPSVFSFDPAFSP